MRPARGRWGERAGGCPRVRYTRKRAGAGVIVETIVTVLEASRKSRTARVLLHLALA